MALLFLHLILAFSLDYHALYLSTCEIVIEENHQWHGQLRIFHDDLEDALSNLTGKRPNLDRQLDPYQVSIQKYLNDHLLIENTHEKVLYIVSELSRNQDIIEILIKGMNPWIDDITTVRNDLLMELFESQKNVMIIKKSDKIHTFYLKKSHTTEQVDLQH